MPEVFDERRMKRFSEYLIAQQRSKGFIPSFRELASIFGISPSTVHKRIHELNRRGTIRIVAQNVTVIESKK